MQYSIDEQQLGFSIPTDKKGVPLVRVKRWKVEEGILPKGIIGEIITPTAALCNGKGFVVANKRKGSDDNTYKFYPELVQLLPRGLSVLILRNESGGVLLRKIICGFPKFTGSTPGDEDSGITADGLFMIGDFTDVVKVVRTEKANGKFMVFTAFHFQDQLYYFGGSKTVHFVVPVTDDTLGKLFEFYEDNQASFAFPTMTIMIQLLEEMEKEKRTELIDLLVGGNCLTGEYCDGKHMVALEDPSQPKVQLFGFTQDTLQKDRMCGDVLADIEYLRNLGLPTVDVQVYDDMEEFWKIKETLRLGANSEGFVLYYQVPDKDGFKTVAMEKYKLWWYIIIRVIREFLRGLDESNSAWKTKLVGRIKKRNDDFMFMPGKLFDAWCTLAIQFIDWFLTTGQDKSRIGFDHASDGMAEVWKQFKKETGAVDEFDASYLIAGESVTETNEYAGLFVVYQGFCPGAGKSVIDDLVDVGLPMEKVEQDAFAKEHGKKSGKACLEHCKKLFLNTAEDRVTVVTLRRNNSNWRQYSNYVKAAQNAGWKVVYLVPEDLNTVRGALACLQRVSRRDGHATFDQLSIDKRLQITIAFLASIEITNSPNVIPFKLFQDHWGIPDEVKEYYLSWKEEAEQIKNPFDVPERKGAAKTLQLDLVNYECGRPLDEIVMELSAKIRGEYNKITIVDPTQPTPLYIGAMLDTKSKKPFFQALGKLGIKKFGKSYIHHCTLAFRPSHDNPCMRLFGTKVTLTITGIAISPNKVVAAACTITGPNGENMDHFVESGVPHVTIFTGKKVAPVESGHLLVRIRDGCPEEGEVLIPLEKPFQVKGIIEGVYP